MTDYELIFDYRSNKQYNNELLNLIKKESSKSSYESWISRSKWDDNYVPYGLINEQGNIVANVGVFKMKVFYNHVRHKAIQLIGLLVKPEYKDKDVGKILIEKVLDKYQNIVDIIYSYDEKINVYLHPDKGFLSVPNKRLYKQWNPDKKQEVLLARRIETNSPKELGTLLDVIKHSTLKIVGFSTNGDSTIKLYNILKHFSRNVHFIPYKNIYVVFVIENNVFKLLAVFSSSPIIWEGLLEFIIPEGIEEIEFGFLPPECLLDVKSTEIINHGNSAYSWLYRKNIKLKIISGNFNSPEDLFFPLLSHGK